MDLVSQLDPNRDYGSRTYEQVVAEVESGALILAPGKTLPVIRDAKTNHAVSGTGRPPGKPASVFSRAFIQKQFAKNAKEMWDAAFKYALEGDARYAKLLFEYGMGAPQQARGDPTGAEDFLRILAAAAESTQRRVTIDG